MADRSYRVRFRDRGRVAVFKVPASYRPLGWPERSVLLNWVRSLRLVAGTGALLLACRVAWADVDLGARFDQRFSPGATCKAVAPGDETWSRDSSCAEVREGADFFRGGRRAAWCRGGHSHRARLSRVCALSTAACKSCGDVRRVSGSPAAHHAASKRSRERTPQACSSGTCPTSMSRVGAR